MSSIHSCSVSGDVFTILGLFELRSLLKNKIPGDASDKQQSYLSLLYWGFVSGWKIIENEIKNVTCYRGKF